VRTFLERDLLHTLLDIQTATALEGHPKVGASWEGFLLGAVVARLGARADQCYFWATHDDADSFRLAPKIHALAAARLFEAL
jgi:hypothetical protein